MIAILIRSTFMVRGRPGQGEGGRGRGDWGDHSTKLNVILVGVLVRFGVPFGDLRVPGAVNLDRNGVQLDLCENDEKTGSKMHENWGSLMAPWWVAELPGRILGGPWSVPGRVSRWRR